MGHRLVQAMPATGSCFVAPEVGQGGEESHSAQEFTVSSAGPKLCSRNPYPTHQAIHAQT